MRQAEQPIPVLTCYDYPTAKLMTECGVPVLLVGDSAAMTVLGEDSTVYATMDFLVTITKAVRRGAPYCYLMADMPFGSYPDGPTAVANALRFVKESGADCVKLECDGSQKPIIEALAAAGVVVCVHLGLLPQRAAEMGYKAQGRTDGEAKRIIEDAVALQQAGAGMILLEAVPDAVSAELHHRVECPIIGCGAGPSCDGHVLVIHDLLGFNAKPARFVEVMADVPAVLKAGISAYVSAVKTRGYPAEKHQYKKKASD